MKTTDHLLAKFLNCTDPHDCEVLNSIVLDVGEFFDDIKANTVAGVCIAVYNKALEYLQNMYDFAKYKVQSDLGLYNGSVLNWDPELLRKAISFLSPENNLHWGISSDVFYLELDNWDLYASVIDTINEDYGSGEFSFRDLCHDYTTEFYGGEKTPDEYDPLLQ